MCYICVLLKTKKQVMKKVLSVCIVLVIVSMVVSSCSRKGYGCRGRESWNHMVRRINNGY
jgi:hypothetical protein